MGNCLVAAAVAALLTSTRPHTLDERARRAAASSQRAGLRTFQPRYGGHFAGVDPNGNRGHCDRDPASADGCLPGGGP
jgi:hypothetical protein